MSNEGKSLNPRETALFSDWKNIDNNNNKGNYDYMKMMKPSEQRLTKGDRHLSQCSS